MRPLRNFKTNQCCHLISRIARRAFFLDDEEKTRFVERLWRVATFSGVEVLTYCIMSNHFHILVCVPRSLENGSDKVAYDLLKQLADGLKRPAELRAALGIASANFFTVRYLTPLAKAGYISLENPASIHSPLQRYRLQAKGRRLVR